jgi:starch phosphorylase
MSMLDGWFDEAEDGAGGWAIGDREPYSPDRDDAHAAGMYSALENEIAPLYYERDQGVPEEWMRRVKQSLRYLSAHFNCQRMVEEYRTELYDPAHRAFQIIAEGRFQAVRERVRWSRTVVESWPRVRFTDCRIDAETVSTGSPVALRAEVDLAGLSPDDVRVEALVGRVGPGGELEEVQVLVLEPREQPGGQQGNVVLFGRDIVPYATGRLGFSVRIAPNHVDDPINRACNALLKWAGEPPGN